ncbi:PAAR domain-containing protein [Pantoea sp. AS-PWVM4]|uniref:PAAR domain-containing protein n=1 Tax=Pantoea sp. AS-PWVM4 TaxID=1332069 RepID=UPI001F424C70|nr:PAAR domain-containing protein [Pantoea sp. AS-PWVM4]
MTKGIVLCQGDRTSCGGKITAGSAHGFNLQKPQAQEGDPVTCGKEEPLSRERLV